MSCNFPGARAGVSAIVPVLNEQARIVERLDELSAMPGLRDVLVVDGGSTDDTVGAAQRHGGAHVLKARHGRAAQMNAGAHRACGDVLLFVHADVQLPTNAVDWVHTALSDQRVIAGAFRTWHVADAGPERRAVWLHVADLRSRYTKFPYGDQGIFVRRHAFEQVGGFPDLPLMEDLELSLRLSRLGRIQVVPASVRVSGRRFLAHPLRDTLLVSSFPLLYRLGTPPHLLAQLYRNVR